MTKIFTPFCRSRRADSKYIYFVGSHKVFFYYNYIIGGKNSKIVQIPRLSGTQQVLRATFTVSFVLNGVELWLSIKSSGRKYEKLLH